MTEPVLDRATITEALRRLGERLAYRGVYGLRSSAQINVAEVWTSPDAP